MNDESFLMQNGLSFAQLEKSLGVSAAKSEGGDLTLDKDRNSDPSLETKIKIKGGVADLKVGKPILRNVIWHWSLLELYNFTH